MNHARKPQDWSSTEALEAALVHSIGGSPENELFDAAVACALVASQEIFCEICHHILGSASTTVVEERSNEGLWLPISARCCRCTLPPKKIASRAQAVADERRRHLRIVYGDRMGWDGFEFHPRDDAILVFRSYVAEMHEREAGGQMRLEV